jgi:hypothetical protein
MSHDQLTWLKEFLADRPEWAFLAISMACNLTLFGLLMNSLYSRIKQAERWAPIADRLSTMFGSAAQKAKKSRKLPDSEE